MRKLVWFVLLLPLSFGLAHARADDRDTRQVLQGDLVYRAQAIALSEVRATYMAQARAAWMLSVECGAPPREARVYRQASARTADGAFSSEAEVGTPIADCETVRAASSADRERLSQPELSQMAAYYEAELSGPRPSAPSVPAVRPPEPLPVVHWTPEQEASHARAIAARAELRLQERERVMAEYRSQGSP